jgi:hypothetical protein
MDINRIIPNANPAPKKAFLLFFGDCGEYELYELRVIILKVSLFKSAIKVEHYLL